MKKALLLTDGSIDLALSLSQWVESQSESVALTIVCPFSLTPVDGQPLKSADYARAKQAAHEKLNHWLNFLPKSWLGQFHAEMLPGEPNLVLTIYLLMRQYDYLLIESWQEDFFSTYLTLRCQISTQLCWLNLYEEPMLLATGL